MWVEELCTSSAQLHLLVCQLRWIRTEWITCTCLYASMYACVSMYIDKYKWTRGPTDPDSFALVCQRAFICVDPDAIALIRI